MAGTYRSAIFQYNSTQIRPPEDGERFAQDLSNILRRPLDDLRPEAARDLHTFDEFLILSGSE